jgi:hypothetical protein
MSWAELVDAAAAIQRAAVAAAAENASEVASELAPARIVGVGWATVEAERAFAELDGRLGSALWSPVDRDALLGASAWRRMPSPDGSTDLFVLEPDTEGRLAASLARFGEGVAAVYVQGAAAGAGPVSAPRIVPVNPRWGPYVIVRGAA